MFSLLAYFNVDSAKKNQLRAMHWEDGCHQPIAAVEENV
jgi:hypothetical protein